MLYEDFTIIEPNEDGDTWTLETTHPKITYDSFVETYLVDLGEGETVAEIYGRDRSRIAFELAELWWNREEG